MASATNLTAHFFGLKSVTALPNHAGKLIGHLLSKQNNLRPNHENTPVPEPISIADAQSQVDQWIKSIGVRYFSELTNLAQLVEEVGELARVISRTYGEQSFKDSEGKPELADEMADVLFVLICLANQTGVDLTDAFQKNLVKKTDRDKDRHQNNPKLK